ncbi:MAG: hypothetical protein ACTSRP_04495 [Candidatus Helarchaeota archaeon]
MFKRIKKFKNRIKAFITSFCAGIIFLVSGITDIPIFGQRYLEFVQTYFSSIDPTIQVVISNVLNIMMTIANYTGLIVFISSILILFGRVRITRIILFIVVGIGIYGFLIPIITALVGGIYSVSLVIDSISTKYAVAVLLTLISKQYLDKIKKAS